MLEISLIPCSGKLANLEEFKENSYENSVGIARGVFKDDIFYIRGCTAYLDGMCNSPQETEVRKCPFPRYVEK